MKQTLAESLRTYASIIAEADNEQTEMDSSMSTDDWKSDDENPAFNVPDEDTSLEDEHDHDPDEPVMELSHLISVQIGGDEQKIEQAILGFLQKNKLELIPIGGISDTEGQV